MFIVVALTGGCAYRLGPTNGISAGARTVKFAQFVNKTDEPRVTEYLGNSLRKQLQRDGTFHLQTSGAPDILVSGEITRFRRTGLSYDPNDVLTPQEYTLVLEAQVKALNVNTGKVLFDKVVRGTTFIRVGTDEFSSERQAIPILTDTLAQGAVSLLADGNW